MIYLPLAWMLIGVSVGFTICREYEWWTLVIIPAAAALAIASEVRRKA